MAAISLADQSKGDTAKPLRVLSVIPGNGEGASFIFARRQAQSLIRLGIDVRVYYCQNRRTPLGLLTEWRRLRGTIIQFDPQLVHANYGTITAFICALAWLGPLVITFRGSDLNPDLDVGLIRVRTSHLLSQLASLRAKRVICTSANLLNRLWWSKEKAQVVPSGISLEVFRPIPQEQAREALHWDTQDRVVLFNAGRSPGLKGLNIVKEAMRVAEKKIGPIRLHVLEGLTKPEDVPLFMNAANCLVLASRSEGSPNVVKEALACNLPVVAVDVGDVVERLRGVSPSAIVPAEPEKMGAAIADILLLGIRSNGRQSVFSISEESVAQKLRSLYQSCLGSATSQDVHVGVDPKKESQPALGSMQGQ